MGVAADLLKVADVTLGRPLCALVGGALRLRRRQAAPAAGDPQRILVIRPGGIGDAVLFVPLLQELRRVWPDATLDVLMERRNAGVLDGVGLADRVLRYDRFPWDLWRAVRGAYDLVIDTEQYHCLSALVAAATRAPIRVGFGTNARKLLLTHARPYSQDVYEVHSFLDLARAITGRSPQWDPERPFYPLGRASIDFAERALAELSGLPLAAIHPGASIPERRWPPERYAALARALADDGMGIVILGGSVDVKRAAVIDSALRDRRRVNLAGRTALAQAAAVVSRVDVYVSADTGLLHLAYGVGTPTVYLFGSGVLAKWGPPGGNFTTIDAQAPCSPCTVYGYTPPCCQGLVCMLEITPERVREAVRARLAASQAASRAARRQGGQ